MDKERQKRRAATVSLAYNASLTAIKLVAAAITGSVSLLSEGVHSATDVVASTFSLISVRAAALPPDEEHPYGHGKIESVAGFGEAILLLGIVAYIVFEAVQRLIYGGGVQSLDVGLAVMAVSAVTSLFVARYVSKVGERTDSLALRSNGQHLMVDFWTSVGVLVALAITRATGWERADAVCALAFAAWIAYGAWGMVCEAFDQLIDRALPAEEMAAIAAIMDEERGCLSWHRLRARHSGSTHYVDVHVVVPREWSVVQAHDLADRLEKKIEARLAPAVAVIHVDPFDAHKSGLPTE
ncbi:MAG: cation diffusion facilitator family transporter [Fimbriimonas sp.]